MKKVVLLFVLVMALAVVLQEPVAAQCAMCKSAKQNNTAGIGAGLNTGIIYLMSVPYLAGGIIAFLWYRNSKKRTAKNA